MPPKAAKRKTISKGANGDDDPRGTPDEIARKKTRVSVSRVDEYDEDQGRKNSKQFQAWGDWQTKFKDKEKSDRRQFANTYKQDLEARRQEVQTLFTRAYEEDLNLAGSKKAELIKQAFADTKSASGFKSKAQAHNVPKARQEHPVFKAGLRLFQGCRDLVTGHEQANANASAHGSIELSRNRAQWSDDRKQVEELLSYGRQHGENIVECIVIPSSTEENKGQLLTPNKELLSETGKMAVDMYRKSAQGLMKGGRTWGETARAQVDAFERVVDGMSVA